MLLPTQIALAVHFACAYPNWSKFDLDRHFGVSQ